MYSSFVILRGGAGGLGCNLDELLGPFYLLVLNRAASGCFAALAGVTFCVSPFYTFDREDSAGLFFSSATIFLIGNCYVCSLFLPTS